jgi:hypothetical protein
VEKDKLLWVVSTIPPHRGILRCKRLYGEEHVFGPGERPRDYDEHVIWPFPTAIPSDAAWVLDNRHVRLATADERSGKASIRRSLLHFENSEEVLNVAREFAERFAKSRPPLREKMGTPEWEEVVKLEIAITLRRMERDREGLARRVAGRLAEEAEANLGRPVHLAQPVGREGGRPPHPRARTRLKRLATYLSGLRELDRLDRGGRYARLVVRYLGGPRRVKPDRLARVIFVVSADPTLVGHPDRIRRAEHALGVRVGI